MKNTNAIVTELYPLVATSMGKNLNKWYDAINEEYLKQVNSHSNNSKGNKGSDIKEGF